MDIVRDSTFTNDGYYEGTYNKEYKTKDATECKYACVSDKDCEMWRYVSGLCGISSEEGELFKMQSNVSSGKIVTRQYFSIVQATVFILFLILFGAAFYRLLQSYSR